MVLRPSSLSFHAFKRYCLASSRLSVVCVIPVHIVGAAFAADSSSRRQHRLVVLRYQKNNLIRLSFTDECTGRHLVEE